MFSGPIHVLLLTFEQGQQSQRWASLNAELSRVQFQFTWSNQLADVKASILADLYHVILLDCSVDQNWAQNILMGIRAHDCDVPIVALCDVDDNGRDMALRSGADDYIYYQNLDAVMLDKVVRYSLSTNGRSDYYAQYDPLTRLPNRLLFLELFAQTLSRMQGPEANSALLYIDLDQFQQINENYGNQLGDLVLKEVSQRLSACLSERDYVARIGGDEFAIVIEQVPGSAELAHMAAAIAEVLAHPIHLDGQQVTLGTSMGVAVYPDSGKSTDALLQNARLAADLAKQTPGSSYRFYDEKITAKAKSQLYREADLRRGLRSNEFVLHYQPRVCLKSGKIIGVEALLRWQHPKRGLIAPDDFIPLAEQVGLIQPLGYWVLYQACKDLNKLRDVGLDDLDIAINLSFKQFQDEHFVAKVVAIMDKYQVSPQQIEFELTETTIMDNDTVTIACMEKLAELGSTFSLDDFGTGFSSFVHIQRLPISALKIDKSFVQHVNVKPEDADMVKAMVAMSHSLGMDVVAEGAEDQAQMNFLKQINCDQVQGYYFSPPVPFAKLSDMLARKVSLAV